MNIYFKIANIFLCTLNSRILNVKIQVKLAENTFFNISTKNVFPIMSIVKYVNILVDLMYRAYKPKYITCIYIL